MSTLYDLTPEEQQMAALWHGGQASILYAVASTGALARGTIRPSWTYGDPFTDAEWDRDLVARLLLALDDITPTDDTERDTRNTMRSKLEQLALRLDREEEP